MIRSELVDHLMAKNPHLSLRDVRRVVDTVLETIAQGLAEGKRVELRQFGVFAVRTYPARQGRNPMTGETLMIPPRVVPTFRVSKSVVQRLNRKR